MSTVNGMPFEEALKKLRDARPEKEEKGDTGFLYYNIDTFISTLDQILGCGGYSFSYSDPICRMISTGQEMLTVRCSLDIYADDGSIIKHCEGFGDREVMPSKGTGRVDVGNLTASVGTFAFKDACKYLGIFGYRTSASGAQKRDNRSKNGGKSRAKDNAADEVVNFSVLEQFYQNGESGGFPVWKLPVRAGGVKGEVVFYHNQTKANAEKFNRFMMYVKDGVDKGTVTVRLKVKPSGERQGLQQYVFKAFAA